MADLQDLALWCRNLAGKIPDAANEQAKVIVMTIMNDLVQVTPVQTGAALSNWQVTLDFPAFTVLPPYFGSPKAYIRKGVRVYPISPTITAQRNAPAVLDAARKTLAQKRPGQEVFITNNVEYIEALNSGTSAQAPSGFVDRAIILGNKAASQAKVIP